MKVYIVDFWKKSYIRNKVKLVSKIPGSRKRSCD